LPNTRLYKIIFGDDPENPQWCEVYNPDEYNVDVEVFFSPTVSQMEDGSLGIFFGSGSPYDGNILSEGYLFGIRDANPERCLENNEQVTHICNYPGFDGSYYPLDFGLDNTRGSRMTTKPIIYDGIVYFSVWNADSDDRCGEGTGYIYSLAYDTCTVSIPGEDDDGLDPLDSAVTTSNYISSMVLTDMGTLLYSSSPNSNEPIGVFDTQSEPSEMTTTIMMAPSID